MNTDNILKSLVTQGKTALNLSVGIISHITDEHYTVIAIDSDYDGIYKGDVFALEDTYCRDVITHARTMTYDDVAEITEMLKHPVYLNTQLRAYIGTPLVVNGRVWGTLSFSSQKPKQPNFGDRDYKLVESLAKQLEHIIEGGLKSASGTS